MKKYLSYISTFLLFTFIAMHTCFANFSCMEIFSNSIRLDSSTKSPILQKIIAEEMSPENTILRFTEKIKGLSLNRHFVNSVNVALFFTIENRKEFYGTPHEVLFDAFTYALVNNKLGDFINKLIERDYTSLAQDFPSEKISSLNNLTETEQQQLILFLTKIKKEQIEKLSKKVISDVPIETQRLLNQFISILTERFEDYEIGRLISQIDPKWTSYQKWDEPLIDIVTQFTVVLLNTPDLANNIKKIGTIFKIQRPFVPTSEHEVFLNLEQALRH